jgi:hypothetical protein
MNEDLLHEIRERLIRIEERQSQNTDRIERIEEDLIRLKSAWIKIGILIITGGAAASGAAAKITTLL